MKELNSNVYIMSKSISGRGKILFYKEGDREKMEKKYPDIEFIEPGSKFTISS